MSTDDYVSMDEPTPEAIVDDLAELRAQVDDPEAREQVNDLMERVADLQPRGFGNVIVGFDRADVAEAALGALLFGIPMFVEGGTGEVGSYLAARPPLLFITVVAAVALTYAIVYVAEFQDVRVHEPFFGIIPQRMVGVTGVSFLIAALGLTLWGRLAWTDPWLAVCTTSVAFVPMTIGAALGDILPGS